MSLEAWGDEGEGATHGRDTEMYAELLKIRGKLSEWYWGHKRRKEFFNDEMEAKATKLLDDADELLEEIAVPL